MIFRKCSINGKVYSGDVEEVAVPSTSTAVIPEAEQASSTDSSSATATVTVPKPEVRFHSAALEADIAAAVATSPSLSAEHARALHGFFSVLALCHTVLTSIDRETGKIDYKAQSPDEAALVQAAADAGYIFRGRDREVLTLQTPFSTGPDDVDRYELLNILEFTSARKRMSVVVRKLDDEDGRLFLLMKGADNVVYERLRAKGDEALREQTEADLSEFANGGLRTLTLAYRVVQGAPFPGLLVLITNYIIEDEYREWSERYHEATVALEEREEKIEKVSAELEYDLRLLGATAIEDSLQDGVPEAIADLKRAGIKIWVATGDKLETAIGRCPFLVCRII